MKLSIFLTLLPLRFKKYNFIKKNLLPRKNYKKSKKNLLTSIDKKKSEKIRKNIFIQT